jgi:hypothetical protein
MGDDIFLSADGHGVDPLAHRAGDDGGHDQDPDHERIELPQQLLPPGHRRRVGQLVGSVLVVAPLGFGVGQAALAVGVPLSQGVAGRHRMRGLSLVLFRSV